jgi:hypothetical protein
MNRITGRSAFLALLRDEGITHLFGSPGTTELPNMHALKERGRIRAEGVIRRSRPTAACLMPDARHAAVVRLDRRVLDKIFGLLQIENYWFGLILCNSCNSFSTRVSRSLR